MKIKKIRILLVEKSPNLRWVLKDFFEMMNYELIDFENGETAIKKYKDGCCDICLLNIDLQKKNGYVVIEKLRNITPELPVIFISDRVCQEDKIMEFKAGCDDYVTKPFSTEELLFRIETVLKRCKNQSKKMSHQKEIIFYFGNLTFNYNNLKLICGVHVRILTKKEAQLLKLLCEHQNKLVPKEILLKEIWGDSKAADGRSLDVFISRIRTYLKINEECKPIVEILNVHGIGYLLKIC
jgi:DNA-binding response OmpR family regulator